MKYCEYATPKVGIFKYMGIEFPNMSNEQMDLLFWSKYGQKTVAPLVLVTLETLDGDNKPSPTDDEWKTLALIVSGVNSASWSRKQEALEYEYDIPNAYIDTRSTTTEHKSNSNGNSSQLEKSGVYGFDSEETPSDDKQNNRTNDNSNHSESSQKITVERKGNIGSNSAKSIQTVIADEIELRNKKFICDVMNDVADMITLQVYE